MIIVVALIGVSLLIALGFLTAFIWSYRSGQFDDPFGQSVRLLFDDKPNKKSKSNQKGDNDHQKNESTDKNH